MAQFELLARERTLEVAALAVTQLADLVVAPELVAAIVKLSNTMSAAALNLLDHEWLVELVEQVRQVGDERQVLQVTRPVDAERTLQVVSACVDLLEDEASLLALCDDHRHFFTGRRVDDEQVGKWTSESRWCEDGVHRVRRVSILSRVRQLLLVVVAPAVDLSILCDSETVTEAAD